MKPRKKNGFIVSFYGFLYIVGIQSVRILKRLKRRTARFFCPAVCFAADLLRRIAGPRVAALKTEGGRIREGFGIARERIFCAWKKGVAQAAGEFFRAVGKSMLRHRRGLVRVFNIVAPVAGVCILVFTVQNWANRDFGLLLQQGEQTVALLRDEQTFQQAEEMVNVRNVTSAARTGKALTPRYTLAMTGGANFASATMLCDTLIANSGEEITGAVGLYIDGRLIGALKSRGDLNFLLQERLNQTRGDDLSSSAFFVQRVELVEGLYPVDNLIAASELREILNSSLEEEAYHSVSAGDTLSEIASQYGMSLDNLAALNPDVVPKQMREGDSITIQQAKPLLNVRIIREEAYNAPVDYSTIATQDDNEYTDYSLVTQEGQDGEARCVDRVTLVDGVETGRETVKRITIQEPVNKLVTVGTKKRPLEGWATGEMTWPLPFTHNITSRFGSRWGTIHKGLDVASGGVYGQTIVAADGGTVKYVKLQGYGYGNHLAIDHGNGLITLYAHNSEIYVTSGQKVARGQPVAAVGNTGDSTGPHLHFEVLVGGSAVNPIEYLG